jgi:UDP-glucose 4-epimerase
VSGGPRVLVTGASGYIGGKLVPALASQQALGLVVATDIRLPAKEERVPGIVYEDCDVRDAKRLRHLIASHAADTVVHLASIVTPGRDSTPELEYEVDVGGTRNVLDACLAEGVRKLIVTSSGAAYGYHADNPEWLDEEDPIRGHESFTYARHKRLVEGMLAEARRDHPELAQLVFRPGTILGEGVHNQITALFAKHIVPGVIGTAVPWVFIWDEDVVACLVRGIREPLTGVYNLAGDGTVAMREVARRMGKPCLPLPAWLLRGALTTLRAFGLTRYGPEQVDFLRYRPVLSNRRLKEEFGYTPRKTSSEVLDFWLERG